MDRIVMVRAYVWGRPEGDRFWHVRSRRLPGKLEAVGPGCIDPLALCCNSRFPTLSDLCPKCEDWVLVDQVMKKLTGDHA